MYVHFTDGSTPPATSNPVEATWWWTPDCGYLHVETNPASLSMVCPDGVAAHG